MSRPFFSIVVPTKDRPQFILETVTSAVEQQFRSFEVILSDNSSDLRTRDRIQTSDLARRVTYIKPPWDASMPDHWEFATLQAKGEYTLVLTDRSVLKQGALAAIYRAISEYGKDVIHVCAWRWSLFDDELGIESPGADGAEIPLGLPLDSADVAAMFVGPQNAYPYTLPRALNSCYSNEIAARIRAQHGKLFVPISPDFTSAFLMLAHAEKILYIDAPLFISRGLSSSTGGKGYRGGDTSYLDTLGLKDWYRYVPIKALLVENLVFEDFLAMRDMAGGGLRVEINWVEYFVRCYRELLGKSGGGILNRHQVNSLQREWERALKDMDADTQRRVGLQLRSMWALKLRAVARELPFGTGLIAAVGKLRKLAKPSRHMPTTVLQAAGYDLPEDSDFSGSATYGLPRQ